MSVPETTRRIVKTLAEQTGLLDPLGELAGRVRAFSIAGFARNLRYRTRGAPDRLPLPPAHLIYLTIGSTDIFAFLESGKAHARTALQGTLKKNGRSIDEYERVLDFGCGCGRVLRFLAPFENVEFDGVDYNPEQVAWCQKSLPFGSYRVNRAKPPLDYRSENFDLVFARSVFTHLSEPTQWLWLREFRRILGVGGDLLFTVSGRAYFPGMSQAEIERFEADRLVVRAPDQEGKTRCAAFHPESLVRKMLSRNGFSMVDVVPGKTELYLYQDTYLARKRSA